MALQHLGLGKMQCSIMVRRDLHIRMAITVKYHPYRPRLATHLAVFDVLRDRRLAWVQRNDDGFAAVRAHDGGLRIGGAFAQRKLFIQRIEVQEDACPLNTLNRKYRDGPSNAAPIGNANRKNCKDARGAAVVASERSG